MARRTGSVPERDTGTRVVLVRHGQSTWNADGRWQGQADPPLSERGEDQAREAATRVHDVHAVWSSDLARARRTAELVAEPKRLEVHVDPRLRERHAGPWEGLTRAEIDSRWPDHLSTGRRPDGYEPDDEVAARALAVLDDLARAHAGEQVLVVTHGGIVRVLERHLGATDGGLLPNLSGRVLHADGDGTWRLGERVLLLSDDSVTVPRQL
jgi:broad specificity phosphatase PhoE